ncbi:hypothetical protein JG687_00015230 [Phytophthora cactorum]|uniref:ZSWIM1/3 RNaseH-like domain-containing protein n=1 Tax=Phytophthora cactorum TaxID=29920 RepID=A0A8T1TWT6_9STRA|nr:hypothetical protein JG687_00015230 [Phytophthora cactorum]
MVRVTGSSTSHNHRVDRAVYENNPSVRRVEDPVLLAFVDAMQSSGSKPKRIMQFLREKTATSGDSSARILRAARNRASVFVDDVSLAQTISLQTRQMRRRFKAFPVVLLVDATHNTNDSRYKLFSFMIHDVYGHASSDTYR